MPERGPRAWLALAFALAAVAFLGDWLTGAEISFSPFYLVGIGVGTWFAGRRAGVALSLASTAGWVGAYLLTGQRYSRPSILYWNVLRTAEESLAPPDRVLADLNRQLARTIPEARFVTACYAVLEPAAGRFEYALAGHNSPLHVRGAAGPIDTLETAEGPPLGAFEVAAFERRVARLEAGDTIVLYTDGWTEAMDAEGRMFGEDRLHAAVLAAALPADAMRDRLVEALGRHLGTTQAEDDRTLVLLRRDARVAGKGAGE